ncbi:hypothetical protein BLNAU_912 [Blattamonas nauphoetae]|uniref:Uncharacterized protein n=1 Tax=Blattamonas nauphoetae TaxID=2049346 RepID=A0ABQ9YKU1_9EUKA|nr:hypothetical protein BLNAU_912 [Blattamonas nauphoetae]
MVEIDDEIENLGKLKIKPPVSPSTDDEASSNPDVQFLSKADSRHSDKKSDLNRDKRITLKICFVKKIELLAREGKGFTTLAAMKGYVLTKPEITYLSRREQFLPPEDSSEQEKKQFITLKKRVDVAIAKNAPLLNYERNLKDEREIYIDQLIDTIKLSHLPTGPFVMSTKDISLKHYAGIHYLTPKEREASIKKQFSTNQTLNSFILEIIADLERSWEVIFQQKKVKSELEGTGIIDPTGFNTEESTDKRLIPFSYYRKEHTEKERMKIHTEAEGQINLASHTANSDDGEEKQATTPAERSKKKKKQKETGIKALLNGKKMIQMLEERRNAHRGENIPIDVEVEQDTIPSHHTPRVSSTTHPQSTVRDIKPSLNNEQLIESSSSDEPVGFIVKRKRKQSTPTDSQPKVQQLIPTRQLVMSSLTGTHPPTSSQHQSGHLQPAPKPKRSDKRTKGVMQPVTPPPPIQVPRQPSPAPVAPKPTLAVPPQVPLTLFEDTSTAIIQELPPSVFGAFSPIFSAFSKLIKDRPKFIAAPLSFTLPHFVTENSIMYLIPCSTDQTPIKENPPFFVNPTSLKSLSLTDEPTGSSRELISAILSIALPTLVTFSHFFPLLNAPSFVQNSEILFHFHFSLPFSFRSSLMKSVHSNLERHSLVLSLHTILPHPSPNPPPRERPPLVLVCPILDGYYIVLYGSCLVVDCDQTVSERQYTDLETTIPKQKRAQQINPGRLSVSRSFTSPTLEALSNHLSCLIRTTYRPSTTPSYSQKHPLTQKPLNLNEKPVTSARVQFFGCIVRTDTNLLQSDLSHAPHSSFLSSLSPSFFHFIPSVVLQAEDIISQPLNRRVKHQQRNQQSAPLSILVTHTPQKGTHRFFSLFSLIPSLSVMLRAKALVHLISHFQPKRIDRMLRVMAKFSEMKHVDFVVLADDRLTRAGKQVHPEMRSGFHDPPPFRVGVCTATLLIPLTFNHPFPGLRGAFCSVCTRGSLPSGQPPPLCDHILATILYLPQHFDAEVLTPNTEPTLPLSSFESSSSIPLQESIKNMQISTINKHSLGAPVSSQSSGKNPLKPDEKLEPIVVAIPQCLSRILFEQTVEIPPKHHIQILPEPEKKKPPRKEGVLPPKSILDHSGDVPPFLSDKESLVFTPEMNRAFDTDRYRRGMMTKEEEAYNLHLAFSLFMVNDLQI